MAKRTISQHDTTAKLTIPNLRYNCLNEMMESKSTCTHLWYFEELSWKNKAACTINIGAWNHEYLISRPIHLLGSKIMSDYSIKGHCSQYLLQIRACNKEDYITVYEINLQNIRSISHTLFFPVPTFLMKYPWQ